MKHSVRVWITVEAEFSAGGTSVTKLKAINMTQTQPKNSRGVPIEVELSLPDELFLSRMIKAKVEVDLPNVTAPEVTAVPGSRWEEAQKRQGLGGV